MSIQSDIVTALSGVASGNVYPEAAPQLIALPMVIIVRTAREPLALLTGSAGTAKYTFVFECYDKTKAGAITLADSVRAAIVAAISTLNTQYEVSVSADQYEAQVNEYMEPVSFSFWAP